ncbi:MAG: antitoxin [Clostridia bacterium]|nr:antitoxin [Clostridia bacterium]MBR0407302.1 antitoxin [Clostridia bacterium]
MVKMNLNELNGELSAEELRELEAAEAKAPVFDDDSPALTVEQLMQFKRMNRENRTKQTISLRVSPTTLKKAKRYGKGYTSFLSRLLDIAINDEEMVRKCI